MFQKMLTVKTIVAIGIGTAVFLSYWEDPDRFL